MIKRILTVVLKPLSWLNRIIPKKENRVFFYSNLGFRDNVRAMFDYLIETEQDREYEIICSLNDWRQYKGQYPNVRFVSNRRGLFFFLTSKIGFYSFGKYPIKPAKSQTIVNLWHGMPLKRIGNMEEKLKDRDYNFFTYVLATSDFYADIMCQVFSCTREQILLCGQPRNDMLFRRASLARQWELWTLGRQERLSIPRDFEASDKLVWLPTYRDGEKTEVLPTIQMKDLKELNQCLTQTGSYLWIKLHPLQTFESEKPDYDRIFFYTQQDMVRYNLYEVLSFADALITDYSSVYFDYLMLDRPTGFMVADLREYDSERGFVFDDPLAYMPGMQIQDFEGLKRFIGDIAAHRDSYAKVREKVNEKVNLYRDGKSAERIWRKVKVK